MADSTPNIVEMTQKLVKIDSTNPPGNETLCIDYLKTILDAAGIDNTVVGMDPKRSNLVARLPGRGDAPPFLLYGHVDVVSTAGQEWEQPPFSGEIVNGMLWGRGTLDMKGGVAMFISTLLQAKANDTPLPGDLVVAVVSDEEAGGQYGAKFLVEKHAEHFEGVHYAIGEGGGIPFYMGGRKFYAIMITEKQICSFKATLRGPAGHGSMPLRGGAMFKLSQMLQKLDQKRLPTHVTPAARLMIETMSSHLPFPQNLVLRQLLNPRLTGRILNLLGENGRLLTPVLHNTVSPTIVRGGGKINVIPSEITLEMDGRLLPGFQPADMLHELQALLGDEVELEVTTFDPGPGDPDMAMWDTLTGALAEFDPQGIPLPYLLSGVTDARHFSQLGIQTYGFIPMDLPDGLIPTIHAANERVPVARLAAGTQALVTVLQRYQAN